jgi:hypothetical protein
MPGRGFPEAAMARVRRAAAQLEALELAALDQSYRFGPILKEALAAVGTKLGSLQHRVAALEEVGPIRAQLLGRELEPMIEALEDGLKDLRRLLQAVATRPAEPESVYDELAGMERWFLMRLRHTAGEDASDGSYRCCGCGAFNRPGPGMILGWCARCGGNCHHLVSGG